VFVPQEIKITPIETSKVSLDCRVAYGFENNQQIQWRWLINDKEITNASAYQIDGNYTLLNNNSIPIITVKSDSNSSATNIYVKEVDLTQRGIWQCQAINSYGNASQYVNVRVKSNNIGGGGGSKILRFENRFTLERSIYTAFLFILQHLLNASKYIEHFDYSFFCNLTNQHSI
jgi:hypothetical protein